MAKPQYITLEIDGKVADIDPNGQIPTVSYSLEDEQNFEQKKSAEAFDIELPATLINDQIHNSMHDPSILDNTPGQVFDGFKSARYIANGNEILIGKYLQQSVITQNGVPQTYKGKIYGLNGDWVIELKEKTIHDFLNPLSHPFDVATITGSWNFNGRVEQEDFVYAPVRYRKRFGPVPEPTEDVPEPQGPDDNILLNDMRPAISVYWILYRGFKSVGYRIVSKFFDTDYYRKGVLPWTWGGFDYIDDTRWEGLKFVAVQKKPSVPPANPNWDKNWRAIPVGAEGYLDYFITDDGSQAPGAFDNSNLFTYTGLSTTLPYTMKWDYPSTGPLNLGSIFAAFRLLVNYQYSTSNNADFHLRVHWYKNGVQVADDQIFGTNTPTIGTRQGQGFQEMNFITDVNPGDWVGARVWIKMDDLFLGTAYGNIFIEEFALDYVRLGDGSTVNLKGNYPKFKTYNWMDLLRGEIDLFDLSIQTDPVKKEVYIEPTHGFEVDGVQYPGYYNRNQLDFTGKVDISKQAELETFSDYERELVFSFRDDMNDGGLKKVQDRNQTTIGLSKYVLPARYKTEPKPFENRFYSPVMHGEHVPFKGITGVAPQLIYIIPENISNTSSTESENTYNPKRAFYKGKVTDSGGFRMEGIEYQFLPFMFAVNYKPSGVSDPILSYSDQLIGGSVAQGLLKKFFMQRLAILRHGKRYVPIYVMLNNTDVANFLHRESIIIKDIEYVLTSIQDYDPISPQSTSCRMWMFVPKSTVDLDNTYPSITSIRSGSQTSSFDVKYWQHLILTTDIN